MSLVIAISPPHRFQFQTSGLREIVEYGNSVSEPVTNEAVDGRFGAVVERLSSQNSGTPSRWTFKPRNGRIS